MKPAGAHRRPRRRRIGRTASPNDTLDPKRVAVDVPPELAGDAPTPAVDVPVLLESHIPRLRAFLRLRVGPLLRAKESLADIVQSTCREILEHADRYRHGGEPHFRSWLFATATRKVVDRARFYSAGKRQIAREVQPPQPDETDAALSGFYQSIFPTPSQAAIRREDLVRLESAIDRLPDELRDVVLLSRIAGLPHGEIAVRLGRPESSVRVLLFRALARLAVGLRRN